MRKNLGVTAFVLLLISLPIPIFGNYVSLLAVLILAGAAWSGEKSWVVIVDILAWVKMFMLSPTWHLMMFGGGYARGMQREMNAWGSTDREGRALMEGSTRGMESLNAMTLIVTVAILALPVAIMFYKARAATPIEESKPDA